MEAMGVLVTGGTGFLGSEIIKKVTETKKYKVTAVDINPPALGTRTFAEVNYVRANILLPDELLKVFQEVKPAIVIHTAGVYHVGDARYGLEARGSIFEVNVQGTKNVIEAARECGARGLVYTSSITVLVDEMDADFKNADETWKTGRARLSYGQSKTEAENLVLSANTPSFQTCALRAAPIFGPHDPVVIPVIYGCIQQGATPFIVGDGTNLVDFVYVANVADAHLLAVRNLLGSGTAAGEAFFITNGEPIAARDFCIAIWKEFGHAPPFQVRMPRALMLCLGWGAEWLSWLAGKEGMLSRGVVFDATSVRYMNISKARQTLGYTPQVGLEEAVRVSCQHYKQQLTRRSL